MTIDPERDRLSGRVFRLAKVGAGLSGAAASFGANALFSGGDAEARNARALKDALGRLKGPLMKVAQMIATVPDLLPPQFAAELTELQANAPAMGPAFVRRRMAAELGPDWRARFAEFDLTPAAAASLGQVHRAIALDGHALAVKLQYPEMQSAIESDLGQLKVLMGLMRQFSSAIDTREVVTEIGERLREELDYIHEARAMSLYEAFFAGRDDIAVPAPHPSLSTGRLLAMDWMDERRPDLVQDRRSGDPQPGGAAAVRGLVVPAYPHRRHPRRPAPGQLQLHPRSRAAEPAGLRLHTGVSAGVRRRGWSLPCHLRRRPGRRARGLSRSGVSENLGDDLMEVMGVWARFIYAPLLDDRVRTVADGVSPGAYGRREAFQVKKALDEKGPVTIPREFVFMDRAAIGLGAAFLHLGAELNWRKLFEASLEGFSEQALAERQTQALAAAGL